MYISYTFAAALTSQPADEFDKSFHRLQNRNPSTTIQSPCSYTTTSSDLNSRDTKPGKTRYGWRGTVKGYQN